MVRADHIDLTLSLWSLFSGPVRVRDVKIRGARVVLERNGNGQANWDFDLGGDGDGDGDPGAGVEVPIVFENARLEEVELVYLDPGRDQPLRARFDLLELHDAGENVLQVRIAGRYARFPFDLSGHVSPLDRLFAWKEFQTSLAGGVGEGELSIDGAFSDLLALADPELTLDLQGSDIQQAAAAVGLTAVGSGPFRARGRATTTSEGVELMLDVDVDELEADIHGTVRSLLRPDTLDLTLKAKGPDLEGPVAALGLEGLPAGPFDLSGRLRWDGKRIEFEKLVARAGGSELSADGLLGMPPEFPDTDIGFTLSVPDPSVFARLAGIDLPEDPLHAEGRFLPNDDGVELQSLSVRLGGSALRAEGVLGKLPSLEGTMLQVHGEGPDLSVFDALAGVPLPALPFGIDGGLAWDGEGLGLDGVAVRLGPNSASASGRVGVSPRLAGSNLALRLEGPDLASAGALAGLAKLPAEPFEAQGGLRITRSGYELKQVVARVGRNDIEANGTIANAPELAGTKGTLHLAGPDLTAITTLFGLDDLPRDAFDVAGGLRIERGVYHLDGARGTVGGVKLVVDGGITTAPGLDGTDLRIEGSGPDLAILERYVRGTRFPGGPFSVSGRLGIAEGLYTLDQVAGTLDGNRVLVDGTLGPFPGAKRTDLQLDLSGPDLAAAADRAAETGLAGLPNFPAESFAAKGRFAVLDGGYALDALEVAIGQASARLDGTLGEPPEYNGTRIDLTARGADATVLATLTGVSLPAEPFQTRGVVHWTEQGARFDGLVVDLGGYHAELDGSLGPPPRMVGTNLDLKAHGPGLELIGSFVELPSMIPDEAFDIEGHLDGTSEQFSLRAFNARLGKSDLRGSFSLDLRNRPSLHGRFTSDVFDAAAFIKVKTEESVRPPPATDEKPEEEEARDLRRGAGLRIAALAGCRRDLVREEDRLPPGRTGERGYRPAPDRTARCGSIPSTSTLSGGGKIQGTLELGPALNGYRLAAQVNGQDWRFDVTGADIPPDQRPLTRFEFEFEGEGLSPRQMAAGANGKFLIVQEAGLIDGGLIDLLGTGLFDQVARCAQPIPGKGSAHRTGVLGGLHRYRGRKSQPGPAGVAHQQDHGGRRRAGRPGDGEGNPGVDGQAAQGRRPQRQHDHEPLHPGRWNAGRPVDRDQADRVGGLHGRGRGHRGPVDPGPRAVGPGHRREESLRQRAEADREGSAEPGGVKS